MRPDDRQNDHHCGSAPLAQASSSSDHAQNDPGQEETCEKSGPEKR
jgi:hypothetical protein